MQQWGGSSCLSENTLCLGIHNIAITKLTAIFEDLPLKLPQEKLQGKLKKKKKKTAGEKFI